MRRAYEIITKRRKKTSVPFQPLCRLPLLSFLFLQKSTNIIIYNNIISIYFVHLLCTSFGWTFTISTVKKNEWKKRFAEREKDSDRDTTKSGMAAEAMIITNISNNNNTSHEHPPPHIRHGGKNSIQYSTFSWIGHEHRMTRRDQGSLSSVLRYFPISSCCYSSFFCSDNNRGGRKCLMRSITSTSATVRSSQDWNDKKGNLKKDSWSTTVGEEEADNKTIVNGVACSSSPTSHLHLQWRRMTSSSQGPSSVNSGSNSVGAYKKNIQKVPFEVSSSFSVVNGTVGERGGFCRETTTVGDSVGIPRTEGEEGGRRGRSTSRTSREEKRPEEGVAATFTPQEQQEGVCRGCSPPLPPYSSQCTHPACPIQGNRHLKKNGSIPDHLEEIQYICQGTTKYKWVDSPGYETKVLFVEPGDSVRNSLHNLGMPEGFPSTVAPGYKPFFYYSLVGSSISNFSSAIGFQCLLSGFFLSSTPQLWVLKDLFPALLATYLANSVVSYESKPKKWYFISSLFYNFTSIVDIFVSSLPSDFMVFAAVWTSVLKQSSALMFLVTRSCALQHFAIGNNLGVLTKQLNSFAMVIYTLASAAGTVFCYFVPHFYIQVAVALGCLICNQTFITKRILSSIHYRILNLTTMTLLVDCYHHQRSLSKWCKDGEQEERCGGRKVLSPEEVSRILGNFEKLPKELRGIDKLLYISPPLKKLVIHASTLHKDILFTSASQSFSIGLFHTSCVPLTWRESMKRREWPERFKMWKVKLLNLFRTTFSPLCCMKKFFCKEKVQARVRGDVFRGKKLVLLVQVACPGDDVIFANYLLLTAILRHSESEQSLRTFLRRCEQDEMNNEEVEKVGEARRIAKKWREEGETFRELLKTAGWNTTCPMLDHPDFRLRTMLRSPTPYS